METLIAFIDVILLDFFPIALILFVLACVRNSSKPLVAAGVLFAAFAFDLFVKFLPNLLSFSHRRIGHWNWEGGLLSFLWPLAVVFVFKWLSAGEVGLKLQKPAKGLLYGLVFGLMLGGWNVVDGYFLTHLPSKHLIESMVYQLLVPALSEELVFRGLFLAILVHYLGNERISGTFSFGWGIVLVSLLFITVHFINFDLTTGELMWMGSVNLFGNIIIATVALAYLRLKTGCIWPGVLCHGLINSLPFAAAYLLKP